MASHHNPASPAGKDHQQVNDLVERLTPRKQDPARYAPTINAGTITDQVGRFETMGEVIAAFR